ncbi:hypothetical protein Tco_0535331 [Tanacetum coccineum]
MNDEGGNSLSCMLDSAPLGTSFSVVMSAWLASVDCDGAEKGGSLVLTPDRVVIAKVSASGFRGVCALRPHEETVSWMVTGRPTDRLVIGSSRNGSRRFDGFISPLSELEDHISKKLVDDSSVRFAWMIIGFWKPEELGPCTVLQVFERVGSLVSGVVEGDAVIIKECLSSMAEISFLLRCQRFPTLWNSLFGFV